MPPVSVQKFIEHEAWNLEDNISRIDDATIARYERLVNSLVCPDVVQIDQRPVTLANKAFSNQAACFFKHADKNKLHTTVVNNTSPLKEDIYMDTLVFPARLIGTDDDEFVIKSGKYKKLLSEYLVGILALNNLRDIIPNFVLVYGLMRCTPPVSDDNQVYAWCEDGETNDNAYIVYERIPGVSFYKFIKDAAVEDIIKCMVQVWLSVVVAYQRYDFTHYDLHSMNVMIMHLDRPITISYPIVYRGQTIDIKITTDYLAVIIDYGLAHVKINNEDIGIHGYETHSIYPNRSYLMYDIYRLLTYVMYNSIVEYQRQDIVDVLKPIFNMFVIEDPSDIDWNDSSILFLHYQLEDIVNIDDFLQRMSELYSVYLPLTSSDSIEYTIIPYEQREVSMEKYIRDLYHEIITISPVVIPMNNGNEIQTAITNNIQQLRQFVTRVARLETEYRRALYYWNLLGSFKLTDLINEIALEMKTLRAYASYICQRIDWAVKNFRIEAPHFIFITANTMFKLRKTPLIIG